MDDTALFCDLSLARRLELAEGHSTARAVEARASVDPQSRAAWIEVAGAMAMFDGVGSPLTQTFGLGLSGVPSPVEMDAIEGFFRDRGAPVFHEISPLAGPELLDLLGRRGYQPFEFTSVLVRRIPGSGAAPVEDPVRVRLVAGGDTDEWADTSARGWAEVGELGGYLRDLGRITARRRGAHRFLADLDGVPVAAALLSIHDDIALLAGASTVPESRRRGAQLALLEARLRYAAGHGCALATMSAMPGSGSQRNAERQGFRVAYTRIKFRSPSLPPR